MPKLWISRAMLITSPALALAQLSSDSKLTPSQSLHNTSKQRALELYCREIINRVCNAEECKEEC